MATGELKPCPCGCWKFIVTPIQSHDVESRSFLEARALALRYNLADFLDPDKLRLLAAWVDARFPNDPEPDVQNDLRRWADLIEAAQRA